MISFGWWFHGGDNNIPPTPSLKPGSMKQKRSTALCHWRALICGCCHPPRLRWRCCINGDWKSEFFLHSGSLCGWMNQPGPEAATWGGVLLHWAYIHKNTLQVAKPARRGASWRLELVIQCLMQDLAQNREGANKYFWSEWVHTFTAKKKELFNFLVEVAMDSRGKARRWCTIICIWWVMYLMVPSVFLQFRQAD